MQEYRLDLPCGKVRVKETIPKVIVEIEVMIYNVELIMVADLIYCWKDERIWQIVACSYALFWSSLSNQLLMIAFNTGQWWISLELI